MYSRKFKFTFSITLQSLINFISLLNAETIFKSYCASMKESVKSTRLQTAEPNIFHTTRTDICESPYHVIITQLQSFTNCPLYIHQQFHR